MESTEESRAHLLIDVTARLLEGLFQNTAHCKDFVALGGLDQLFSIYSLDTLSIDFSSSPASSSLSYLFR